MFDWGGVGGDNFRGGKGRVGGGRNEVMF